MKSWRVRGILFRWSRFATLQPKEQEELVTLVHSLIAEAKRESLAELSDEEIWSEWKFPEDLSWKAAVIATVRSVMNKAKGNTE